MAAIVPTFPDLSGICNKGRAILWEGLNDTDTEGQSAPVGDAQVSVTVQANGTWDGATVELLGSNDGVVFLPVHDAAGEAVALTADGLASLSDLPLHLKPQVSDEGGGTDLDVRVLVR
jgi:hypothetical protein